MYTKGQILKSLCRTEQAALFVMICGDGTIANRLDQTDSQFRAVVIWCADGDLDVGDIHNDFNKNDDTVDRWIVSSLAKIAKAKGDK